MIAFPAGLLGLANLVVGQPTQATRYSGRPAPKRSTRSTHRTGTITLRANSSLKKHARYLRRKGKVVA